MTEFEQFVSRLLDDGRVVFHGPPDRASTRPEGVMRRLAEAYEAFRLDVAGPPVPFEAGLACEAAELVRQACWALVSRGESAQTWKGRLTMRTPPRTPSEHLSADLLFRYLPQVHRRARAIDANDPVTLLLEELLRAWPLSGALADLEEPPTTPPDFGGHPGLLLLYAERLAENDRPAWRPDGSRAAEYHELVAAAGSSPRRERGGDG